MKDFGVFSYIGRPIYIKGYRRINIGSKVRIYPHARLEALGDGLINIDSEVSAGQGLHIISSKRVSIGKKCTLSANVFISDSEHKYSEIGVHIMDQSLVVDETTIGDNCFIGYGSVIRAGSKLGLQCVVGANSVVKGVFPDYCVVAGNPAVIIKKYNVNLKKWEKFLG